MYKIQSKFFLLAYLLVVLSPIFTLFVGDRVVAESKTLPSYTLKFTPPNKGQSAGSGTRKPKRTAARSLGNLQAIVPQVATDPVLQRPIYQGYTTDSHPVFWLRYNSQDRLQEQLGISIEIKDSKSNGQDYLYQDSFSVSDIDSSQAKIPVKLPQDAPPLVTDTEYRWKFVASIDDKIVGEAIGFIEKVDLPTEVIKKLSDANLEQKAEIYAQWGIWHDLLDTLAQLQEEHPQDSRFRNAWNNLLQNHLQVSSL